MKLNRILITMVMFLHIVVLILYPVYASESSFRIDIPPSKEIVKGGTETVYLQIENTENSSKLVFINVTSECCVLNFPDNVTISPNDRENIPINIHVPLWKNIGQYILEIKVKSASIEKNKMMIIRVRESELIERLEGMSRFSQNLRETIEHYGKIGLDVNNLLGEMDRIGMEIEKAREAVREDDKNTLFNTLVFLEFELYYKVPAEVGSLGNILFLYRVLWLLLFVIVCILIILIYKMKITKSGSNP